MHFAGDDVQVADHESCDGNDEARHLQTLETGQYVRDRRGGGEHDGRRQSECSLRHDVPSRPQPIDRQGDAQQLHLFTSGDERQEHREQYEGDLDQKPFRHEGRAEPCHPHSQQHETGMDAECPDRLRWGEHHGQHEQAESAQLRRGREMM